MKVKCPRCGTISLPNAVVCSRDLHELIAAETDPLLGQMVGGYRVVKRLGLGSMGAVYEARELTIEKRVALKIIHPHLSDDPRLPGLLAEAKAVNAIGDQGIVDIFGFGTASDGRSYLVMELLEGETLQDRLARDERLSTAESIELILPVLHALEAAHAAGFVHRDIKPANVFIVHRPPRPPFPKLLDFGIAKRIKAAAGEALGTPAYCAPEQTINVDVGAKADLYALGCLMFEMLSGQLPFALQSDWFKMMKVHQEAPRPHLKDLVSVPNELDALVCSLMSVEPAARPASAGAVRATLIQIRDGVQSRRGRIWPWVVASLSIVIVAALMLLSASSRAPVPAQSTRGPVEEVDVVEVEAVETPARAAVVAVVADIEHQLEDEPGPAVDALLAAEAAFPGQPEWPMLRDKAKALLRLSAQAMLAHDDADASLRVLAILQRLGPLPSEDTLATQARRVSLAQHNGMVRVGEVFIDRYEYPNRLGSFPTTRVDWADAVMLCKRAAKHLCTEQEWESACRGEEQWKYPYGPKFEKGRCLAKAPRVKSAGKSGSMPRCVGKAGAFDLSGNVAEWTSSSLRKGSPQKVIRGGSFAQSNARLACVARDYSLPGLGGAAHLGFRCCL